MSYFAAALARTDGGWTGRELDLDEVNDLEALADALRDLSGESEGPALLFFEEDDEYLAIVRVDGGSNGIDEPRVFLSDRRAVQNSDVAAMLWEEPDVVDDDEEEGTRPVAEPAGDAAIMGDLGTSENELLELCAEERMLPGDVISELCSRAGCGDVVDGLREA